MRTRAREEEGADREADEARQRVLQGRQRGDADETERPLRPNEKGFRCLPTTLCAGLPYHSVSRCLCCYDCLLH